MSFTTNNPAPEGAGKPAVTMQLARRTSAPAFRPQLIRSVRMHPLLAVGVSAVVLVAVLGYAFRMGSMYLAESDINVDAAAPKLLGDGPAVFDSAKYEAFLGAQLLLAQRVETVKAAVISLPKSDWQEYGETPQQAAEALAAALKVQRVGTSNQISISLKGRDAAKTAAIVNAVTTVYLNAVHKANTVEFDQRGQLLGEERRRIEAELSSAEAEQASLGASMGVASPGAEGGNPYDAELTGIRSQLVEARAAHDVAAAQLAALSNGSGPARSGGLTAAADEAIAGDAGLSSMKASVASQKATLVAQMSGMTPGNPIYKQDQELIASLDRTLDRATTEQRDVAAHRLQDKLRSDLDRTGDVEARLNAELNRQIARATSAAPRLQRSSEVAADILRLQTREASVDDALRGLRMDSAAPAQVQLSAAATVPERPEPSRQRLLFLLALPLALLCGAFAAALARQQDTRIYGAIDVEDLIGFPPLAILPARADVPRRVYEEYVLRMAAGIESAYRTSGARTFLLTAVSLTTDVAPLSQALVRKFQEIGVNVVVATAADMLAPTNFADGGRSGNDIPDQMIVWSEGFVAANVARMKTEHGLVLIESEALLNCGQTEYVARCADATVLVVECGVTTRGELYCAAELLQRLNVTGVGTVLEEMHLHFADSGFRNAVESLGRRQAQSGSTRRQQPSEYEAAQAPEQVESRHSAAREQLAQQSDAALQENARQRAIRQEIPATLLQVEAQHDHAFPQSAAGNGNDWHLPMFNQVPLATAEHPAMNGTDGDSIPIVRRTYLAESHPGPKLVGAAVDSTVQTEEKPGTSAILAAEAEPSHEKMAPKLTSRREHRSAEDDVPMTTKMSWWKRVLGRGSEPAVSIIPEEDDEPEEASQPVGTASAEPSQPVRDRKRETIFRPLPRPEARPDQNFDIPPARLESISRIRPAEAAPVLKAEPSRLQIVPQEEAVALPEPAVEHHDHSAIVDDSHELVNDSHEPHASAASLPPEWQPEDLLLHSPVEATHQVELTEARAPEPHAETQPDPLPQPESELLPQQPVNAVVRKPRRPMSFEQLAGVTASALELVPMQPPLMASPFKNETPVAALPVDLYQSRSPLAAPLLPYTELQPLQGAPDHWNDESERGSIMETEAASPAEPQHEAVDEWSLMAVPPSASFAPQASRPGFAATPAFQPLAVETSRSLEEDDLETVYQEASRHLTTGRWESIPPLRPAVQAWRDRPSPIPQSVQRTYDADLQRFTDREQENRPFAADQSQPAPEAPRSASPETSRVYPTDPLPEPLLTRQWGLLSKFQQARITSGQHVAATPELDASGVKRKS